MSEKNGARCVLRQVIAQSSASSPPPPVIAAALVPAAAVLAARLLEFRLRRLAIVEVRQRHARQALANVPFDVSERFLLARRHEDERVAFRLGAGRAADAMH